ncbi:MAG: DUF4258 domain-containing protein [Planctomycetota bacterium]|nr:DUF4258 domain-containing protein [Planctomycetota bacterium]
MIDRRKGWPEWWQWELELSLHLLRRMIKRQFNEADLRTMLTDATEYKPDVEPERWLISTKWHGRPWEVIVEPDEKARRLYHSLYGRMRLT